MRLEITPEETAKLFFVESTKYRRAQGYHALDERCPNCELYGDKCGNRADRIGTWEDLTQPQRDHLTGIFGVFLRALEDRLGDSPER